MTDKQNFEKDINVLSKEIEYKEDAKDCELAKGGRCCYCKNLACYELEEELKQLKIECENWQNLCKFADKQIDELEAKLKSAKELREYTYDCCKQAGEELAKNSFEWDGKEKNLVVQAMELNERYDQLKAENEALKSFDINLVGVKECEIRQLVQYRKALTEIKEIAENAYCLTNGTNKDMANFAKQILQKISEVENVASD